MEVVHDEVGVAVEVRSEVVAEVKSEEVVVQSEVEVVQCEVVVVQSEEVAVLEMVEVVAAEVVSDGEMAGGRVEERKPLCLLVARERANEALCCFASD